MARPVRALRAIGRACVLLLGALAASVALAEMEVLKRRFVDPSAGVLITRVGIASYRGSAVVARDPRLLYSAAHLFFDNGRWAQDHVFYPAYHASGRPRTGALKPRGFRYFTSYARTAVTRGDSHPQGFAQDFAVLYGNRAFGPAVTTWRNGGAVLRAGTRDMRLVGYPARIHYSGALGQYFQHATDPLRRRARRVHGAFHLLDQVSTGPGASGGAVYVDSGGDDRLAGMIVAGSRTMTGVRTLDANTDALATAALIDPLRATGNAYARGVYGNKQARWLPDGVTRFVRRDVRVPRRGVVAQLGVDLRIDTSNRGDLDVYLRAPSGRIRWLARHGGLATGRLRLRDRGLSTPFRGVRADGRWQLYMRDAVAADRAYYHSYALRLSIAP